MSDLTLELRAKGDPLSAKAADRISELEFLTKSLPAELGDLSELPKDLLNELSITFAVTSLDDQIVTVINAYGGEASLDQILVGLYRKFKVSQKRRFMQNKLYRQSTVVNVEGKKGVYMVAPSTLDTKEPKA